MGWSRGWVLLDLGVSFGEVEEEGVESSRGLGQSGVEERVDFG